MTKTEQRLRRQAEKMRERIRYLEAQESGTVVWRDTYNGEAQIFELPAGDDDGDDQN